MPAATSSPRTPLLSLQLTQPDHTRLRWLSPWKRIIPGYKVAEASAASSSSSTTEPVQALAGGQLIDFVSSGPLVTRVGLSRADVELGLEDWARLGAVLARQLGFQTDGTPLSESQLRRIYQYYLPVFFWCKRRLVEHKEQWLRQCPEGDSSAEPPPLVIGISAPQGCGKSTVVESLQELLEFCNLRVASISLDDFYLRAEEQGVLAASEAGNKLLELRGNAGSHDLKLAEETLKSLLDARHPEASVPLPRYDKSAYLGKGDRAPQEVWPSVKGPVDCVLLEGWMLGFQPLPEDQAVAIDPQLVAVNRNLAAYKVLHDLVDAWVIIQVSDVNWVFKWRLEAEVRMRASGKPGMTDEQVADFVSRYMPAYRAYLGKLYAEDPAPVGSLNILRLSVDESRNPVP